MQHLYRAQVKAQSLHKKMHTASVQFGSRLGIRVLRVFQVMFALFALLFLGSPSSLSFWIWAICLIVFEIFMSHVVSVTLDENGITYLRWNKPVQVEWDQFHTPKQRFAWYMLIELEGRPFWSRYLLLRYPKPSLHEIALSCPPAKRLEELVILNTTGRTN